MYRIIATKRNGESRTWEPVTRVFTNRVMPTADIHKKEKALEEFDLAVKEANADEYLRVNIIKKYDGGWHDMGGPGTSRFFKQDERAITLIDRDLFSQSLDLLTVSMQTQQMMALTYISSDTKEWLRELSTKITNISNELCRLKEQIKEEYYDVQNEQD